MSYRICFISPTFPPDFGWDSVSRQSLELALGLKARGHQVGVVSLARISESDSLQDEMAIVRIAYKNNATHHVLNLIQETTPFSRLSLSLIMQFWKGFLKHDLTNNFDVIIGPDYLPCALLPALTSSAAYLLQRHSSPPPFMSEQMKATGTSPFALDKRFNDFLSELNNEICDCLVSEEAVQGNQTRKTHVVPFSIDAEHFCSSGEKAIDTKNGPAIALRGRAKSEGEISFIKGLQTRLRQENSHIYVTLILDDLPVERREEDEKNKLAEKGIKVDTLINSKLVRNLMPAIWRSHDIVCMLPDSAPDPYSFLEPMACGVPVLSGENWLSSAYVKPGKTGSLLKDESPESFAIEIDKLLSDEIAFNALTQSARNWVVERFSRPVAALKIESAIKDAVERRSSQAGASQRAQSISKVLDRSFDLVVLYQQMLYDFLFVRSTWFKLKHWTRRLVSKSSAKD